MMRGAHGRRHGQWSPAIGMCVLVAAVGGIAVVTAQSARPPVLVLTTGGTIASRVGASMQDGDTLVGAVPQLLEHADVRVEEVARVGSSQITPAHWLTLATRINSRFRDDAALRGMVVTHGTDTLEDTAFFLHLTVRDRRPVVVTGSMRSANEISADGPANLLNAVRTAVEPGAAGQGVLVVLNEHIASAATSGRPTTAGWRRFARRNWAFSASSIRTAWCSIAG